MFWLDFLGAERVELDSEPESEDTDTTESTADSLLFGDIEMFKPDGDDSGRENGLDDEDEHDATDETIADGNVLFAGES